MRGRIALPLLIAVVLAALLTGLPSGKGIITPAGAYEIAPRLQVPDQYRFTMGRLAFTAVYARADASWADVLGAYVTRTAEVVPAEDIRPPGVSQQQINEINQRLINESKRVAGAVALRAAGYDVQVHGQGAEVAGVQTGMPAEGVLEHGDVIVGADGQLIETATELVERVRRHQVGDPIELEVIRNGEHLQVSVGTKNSLTEPGRPVLGVYIGTRGFDVNLPFPVDVDTDGVGGPSAGLMLALGILDGVTPGDLTAGHFVAGTGTINVDGTVGPVGGAGEKMIAAERSGARVFLVPRSDYDDARKRAHAAQVVPVERFEDAIRFLCGLPPAPSSAPSPTPTNADVLPPRADICNGP